MRKMKIPNLFLIGASKTGTTSVWKMLNNHKDVFMSEVKEPCFFSFNNYKSKINSYNRFFINVKNELIVGEASTIYSETTLIPELPQRIYNFNPNSKIIYIIREPISRLVSVWNQCLKTGHNLEMKYSKYTNVNVPKMSNKFEDAIFEYPPFIESCKYWTHLNNYRKYFNDKCILILFTEELRDDPNETLKKICSFLNITYNFEETIYEHRNKSVQNYDYGLVYFLKRTFLKRYFYKIKRMIGIKARLPKKRIRNPMTNELKNRVLKILEFEIKCILNYTGMRPDIWYKG